MDFTDILIKYDIEPSEVRLFRHPNKKFGNLPETPYWLWRNNPEGFRFLNADQDVDQFKDRFKYLAVFVGTNLNDTLFVKFYKIGAKNSMPKGFIDPIVNEVVDEKRRHLFNSSWKNEDGSENKARIICELEDDSRLKKYEGKLIIDWGNSPLRWYQNAGNTSKEILQFNKEVVEPPFPGVASFSWDSDKVSSIYKSWINFLSSSKGVYILVDKFTGNQYIGSATGKQGFYGRWLQYEKDGHGGNKLLKKLKNPIYSIGILEVASSIDNADEILRKENDWKEKLGSRAFGLNAN